MIILNEDSPVAEQPKDMTIPLRWHQLSMIYAMLSAETIGEVEYKIPRNNFCENEPIVVQKCNVGILADKVGAGKTLTVLGLICSQRIPAQNPIPVPHGFATITNPRPPAKTNLIIVPHNIFTQWVSFTKKTTLKVLGLGNRESLDCFFDVKYMYQQPQWNSRAVKCKAKIHQQYARQYLEDQGIKIPDGTKNFWREDTLNEEVTDFIINDHDVIIVSAAIYRQFAFISRGIKWARVFFDEAATVGNNFREYASFYWLITATPRYGICNLAHINIDPHCITYKNSDSFVDSQMVVPVPQAFVIRTDLDPASKVVTDLVPKDVLDMINAGNVEGAATRLNCGLATTDNLIQAFTKSLERNILMATDNINMLKQHQAMDGRSRAAEIKRLETVCAENESKINDIKERLSSIDSELCFICACEFENPVFTECCKHVFCFVCFTTSISGTRGCPYCRQTPKYNLISNKEPTKKEEVPINEYEAMDKNKAFATLMDQLHAKDPKAKILVFSSQIEHSYKVCQDQKIKYKYAKFKGSKIYLNNTLEKYSRGEINILLLDPVHYGSGMNIQMSDYVVLLHRLSESEEIQGIGRAQRCGRDKPLKIVYMINEIEKPEVKYPAIQIKSIADTAKIHG